MKKLVLSTLFLIGLVFGIDGKTGELTGAGLRIQTLLQRNGITPELLEKQGQTLLLGDLTGAGAVVPIHKINMFITLDKIIQNRQVQEFYMRSNAPQRHYGDLISLTIDAQDINRQDIKGIIIGK